MIPAEAKRSVEPAPAPAEAAHAAIAPASRAPQVLLLGLALIVFGGALAWSVRTGGGRIDIRDIRFVGGSGLRLSASLYVPPGVSREHPAPGILAVHGYINSKETQDGFAIELARRGYVVLALDQTGHGRSDPPAFAAGFGGPDGLKYLSELDFVDPKRIGLEGHSMGGWAALAAAAAYPAAYQAIVLVGSSSGTFGTPRGTAVFPRNLGLIFSTWDEFSGLMWEAPIAADIVRGKKLQEQFATTETVQVGSLYGSTADGSARMLYMPRAIHAQDHESTEAIGFAIDWLQRTVPTERPLPPGDQVWYWKEAGTLLAFLGLIVALFPLGNLLLRTRFFKELREAPSPPRGLAGGGWWIAAALGVALPILTYFPLQNLAATLLPASVLFPQTVTTGIMVWAVGNGLLALALFLLWHRRAHSGSDGIGAAYGITWTRGRFGRRLRRSILLAAVLVVLAHGLLDLSVRLFGTDFRFWVVALKPLSWLHLQISLRYALPFAAFFLVQALVMHAQLRRGNPSAAREMIGNAALSVLGFFCLLGVQYVPLLAGGALPLGEPLLTIVAFQFVPLLAITALVSTYFFRMTGHIYVGAIFNALFVTWYIVAGQATHVAL